VKPDFQLTPGNAETVAELCRRLEGVPLAIELAAARTQLHGLRQILERLSEGDSLATRSRDVEGRHSSLHAAVEWSYSLLSPELQRFFARLSVFRGGWTIEAAEAVCEEPLASDYLMQLVELSLVHLDQEARLEPRYRMLEMVRQYAADQLEASGDQPSTRDSHLHHFYELAGRIVSEGDGPDGPLVLDLMEVDHENLLSALDWCQQTPDRLQDALNMVSELHSFWARRGHAGKGAILEKVLSSDSERQPTKARFHALQAAGHAMATVDLDAAEAYFRESLAIARLAMTKRAEARGLTGLGRVAYHKGNYARARQLVTDAVGLLRAPGEEGELSVALSNLGLIAYDQCDYDSAWQALSESLELNRKRGDTSGVAAILRHLGNLAVVKKDYSHANSLYEEGLAIAQVTDKPQAVGILRDWGEMALHLGDTALAISRTSEALEISRQIDDRPDPGALLFLGLLLQLTGDMERSRTHLVEALRLGPHAVPKALFSYGLLYASRLALAHADRASSFKHPETRQHAARLWAAADGIRDSIGAPESWFHEDPWLHEHVSSLRDALDTPTLKVAYEEGSAMTFDQAIAYALEYLENDLATLCRRPIKPATIDQGGS
jgi:tetratricopeptide (TPR) repeat protein